MNTMKKSNLLLLSLAIILIASFANSSYSSTIKVVGDPDNDPNTMTMQTTVRPDFADPLIPKVYAWASAPLLLGIYLDGSWISGTNCFDWLVGTCALIPLNCDCTNLTDSITFEKDRVRTEIEEPTFALWDSLNYVNVNNYSQLDVSTVRGSGACVNTAATSRVLIEYKGHDYWTDSFDEKTGRCIWLGSYHPGLIHWNDTERAEGIPFKPASNKLPFYTTIEYTVTADPLLPVMATHGMIRAYPSAKIIINWNREDTMPIIDGASVKSRSSSCAIGNWDFSLNYSDQENDNATCYATCTYDGTEVLSNVVMHQYGSKINWGFAITPNASTESKAVSCTAKCKQEFSETEQTISATAEVPPCHSTKELLAHYTFDGTLEDVSGNNNDLLVYDYLPIPPRTAWPSGGDLGYQFVVGKEDKAVLTYDGEQLGQYAPSYFVIKNNAELDSPDISFAGWVYNGQNDGGILNKVLTYENLQLWDNVSKKYLRISSDYYWDLLIDYSDFGYNSNNSLNGLLYWDQETRPYKLYNISFNKKSIIKADMSKWAHVAITINSMEQKGILYLDGEKKEEFTISFMSFGTDGAGLYKGAFILGGGGNAFDDVYLYKGILTAEEIKALYENTPEVDSCVFSDEGISSQAITYIGNYYQSDSGHISGGVQKTSTETSISERVRCYEAGGLEIACPDNLKWESSEPDKLIPQFVETFADGLNAEAIFMPTRRPDFWDNNLFCAMLETSPMLETHPNMKKPQYCDYYVDIEDCLNDMDSSPYCGDMIFKYNFDHYGNDLSKYVGVDIYTNADGKLAFSLPRYYARFGTLTDTRPGASTEPISVLKGFWGNWTSVRSFRDSGDNLIQGGGARAYFTTSLTDDGDAFDATITVSTKEGKALCSKTISIDDSGQDTCTPAGFSCSAVCGIDEEQVENRACTIGSDVCCKPSSVVDTCSDAAPTGTECKALCDSATENPEPLLTCVGEGEVCCVLKTITPDTCTASGEKYSCEDSCTAGVNSLVSSLTCLDGEKVCCRASEPIITSCTVESTTTSIGLGETAQYNLICLDAGGTPTTCTNVSWNSSDSSVARLIVRPDPFNTAYPINPGTTNIGATIIAGSIVCTPKQLIVTPNPTDTCTSVPDNRSCVSLCVAPNSPSDPALGLICPVPGEVCCVSSATGSANMSVSVSTDKDSYSLSDGVIRINASVLHNYSPKASASLVLEVKDVSGNLLGSDNSSFTLLPNISITYPIGRSYDYPLTPADVGKVLTVRAVISGISFSDTNPADNIAVKTVLVSSSESGGVKVATPELPIVFALLPAFFVAIFLGLKARKK